MTYDTATSDALAEEREAVENLMQGVRSYRDEHGAGAGRPAGGGPLLGY